MGVSLEKGKYRARYYHKGKNHSLGIFDTELKAKRAISKFKRELESGVKYVSKQGFARTGRSPRPGEIQLPYKPDNSADDITAGFDLRPRKPSLRSRITDKIRAWKR